MEEVLCAVMEAPWVSISLSKSCPPMIAREDRMALVLHYMKLNSTYNRSELEEDSMLQRRMQ